MVLCNVWPLGPIARGGLRAPPVSTAIQRKWTVLGRIISAVVGLPDYDKGIAAWLISGVARLVSPRPHAYIFAAMHSASIEHGMHATRYVRPRRARDAIRSDAPMQRVLFAFGIGGNQPDQ